MDRFVLLYKEVRRVPYATDPNLEKRKRDAVIVIESLVIAENNAVVQISIPIEGVHGTFMLKKRSKWVIEEAHVFES